jgi:hypothetical protein
MVTPEKKGEGLPLVVEKNIAAIKDVFGGDWIRLTKIDPETGKAVGGKILSGQLSSKMGVLNPPGGVRIQTGKNVCLFTPRKEKLDHTSSIERIEKLQDGTYLLFTKNESCYRLEKESPLGDAPDAPTEVSPQISTHRKTFWERIKGLFGRK